MAGLTAGPASASTVSPSPVPEAAATGSIGLRLLDVPVSAGNDPRAKLYILDHLGPGMVIHRRIQVSNSAGSTTRVVLYAAAASVARGSFLGAAGHAPNELSTWTSVQPGFSDVPAGGSLTASVTVTIPRDAAPGERYGVVWAEARSVPDAASRVIQVNRVGIRMYLSVGSGGPPAADFSIDSLTAKRSPDGRPMVLATVHNTGGRALDMSGTLQLRGGPGGLSAGPFPVVLGTTLAIGDTEPVTIALDKQLPGGPWDARITLRSGLLERSARASIVFPDTGVARPVTTRSRQAGRGDLAMAGLLVLLAVAAGLKLRRRSLRHAT